MAARFDVMDGTEEDLLYLDHLNLDRNRVGVIVERGNPFEDYGDRKFEERFRLSKETVWWLLNQINDRLEFPTDRNNPVCPINRLLITSRAYATGAFNILIGGNSNIHRTTAQRIISDVSDIIASLSPRFIKFPAREEVRSVMYGFSQLDRFPGVLGTLDCTHIRIQSPGGHNAELFRNRKSYFSFDCQTISDHNLLVRDIVARWPGSVHNSTIFLNCARRAQFENGEIPQGHLLGDSGYACKSYLLTPLLNPHNEAEHRYNRSQNTEAMSIIVGTAVLHNIARSTSSEEPPEEPEISRLLNQLRDERGPNIEDNEPVLPGQQMYCDDTLPGRAVRRAIINDHFR
ncbi:putative nuclease HARBI1 [Schistocerca americana]|uniref:putative nuclease HARBI1 n=1 Tax=Schistocerca americana TaxID=7009 RepID=UPI001F500FE8|nr:putative nuclease HARBI1 [Schistocerca americana]